MDTNETVDEVGPGMVYVTASLMDRTSTENEETTEDDRRDRIRVALQKVIENSKGE